LVIDKLYKNLPITSGKLEVLEQFLLKEAIESKDRFVKEYGEQWVNLSETIIGMNVEKQSSVRFISKGNLLNQECFRPKNNYL
jgi:type I restriction enzyme R subunit